jgi:hypothetical protein
MFRTQATLDSIIFQLRNEQDIFVEKPEGKRQPGSDSHNIYDDIDPLNPYGSDTCHLLNNH